MPDFPSGGAYVPGGVISSVGPASRKGDQLTAWATYANVSVAWPAANRALYMPITLEAATTVRQIAWQNGTVVSGNVDAGIYDSSKAKVIATGSTAQSETSTVQLVDITD